MKISANEPTLVRLELKVQSGVRGDQSSLPGLVADEEGLFFIYPQNTEKPLKDFKHRSGMIRCIISKLSKDGSG